AIPTCNCPPFAVPAFVTGDDSGFTPGSGSGTNVFSGPPTVQFPGPISQPGDPITQTFADVQGTYSGLFAESNDVTAATAGYFTATTTKKGTVSAKFVMGGKTYSFAGAFD